MRICGLVLKWTCTEERKHFRFYFFDPVKNVEAEAVSNSLWRIPIESTIRYIEFED